MVRERDWRRLMRSGVLRGPYQRHPVPNGQDGKSCSRCHILFDEENPRVESQTICTECAGEIECGHFVIAVAPPEARRTNACWQVESPDAETLKQRRYERYNEKRKQKP